MAKSLRPGSFFGRAFSIERYRYTSFRRQLLVRRSDFGSLQRAGGSRPGVDNGAHGLQLKGAGSRSGGRYSSLSYRLEAKWPWQQS